MFWDRVAYSLIVVANGTNSGGTSYDVIGPSSGIFEAYLWQGFDPTIPENPAMQQLLHDRSGLVDRVEVTFSANLDGDTKRQFEMAGFAIQCSLTTSAGNATLSAAHRTYASLDNGSSATRTGGDQETYPLQVQAVEALGGWDAMHYTMSTRDGTGPDSTWFALQLAIGSDHRLNVTNNVVDPWSPGQNNYPALTPANMTLAIYKLFGVSMIEMMAAGGQELWYGGLYLLEPMSYLKPGIVPWKFVLVLFTIWTFATVAVSICLAFTKRWAPTLGSFEFFQLGAQYTDEVNDFTDESFAKCSSLRNVPGMVGALSGKLKGGTEGFIGLSDSVATFNGSYIHDRTLAAEHRV